MFLKKGYKYFDEKYRHILWHLSRIRGQIITREFLVANLKRIGIKQGDVLLHTSLSSFGHVEGGPDTVIDALLEALGTKGTILMSTYPAIGDWIVYVNSDLHFRSV